MKLTFRCIKIILMYVNATIVFFIFIEISIKSIIIIIINNIMFGFMQILMKYLLFKIHKGNNDDDKIMIIIKTLKINVYIITFLML